MTFALQDAIITIGPLEPALLPSVVTAGLLAWFLGRGLGALTRRVQDPWRRAVYIGPVWVVAGVVLFALPNVIVAAAYPVLHREDKGATVCVAMVWPSFVLPPLVGYLAASMRLRRKHDASYSA